MSELSALDAITEAVESGAGLPEVVRAAARALDASLAVSDAWGATLAVAARSPSEERTLLSQGEGVESVPLRVADTVVGTLHIRAKTEPSAVDAPAAADDDRLGGRARAGRRSGSPRRPRRTSCARCSAAN